MESAKPFKTLTIKAGANATTPYVTVVDITNNTGGTVTVSNTMNSQTYSFTIADGSNKTLSYGVVMNKMKITNGGTSDLTVIYVE